MFRLSRALALFTTAILVVFSSLSQSATGEELNKADLTSKFFLKIQHAQSSETDFGHTLFFDYENSPDSGAVTAFSLGKHLSDSVFSLPLDLAGYVSVQHFDENGFQSDAFGITAYLKLSYDFSLPKNILDLRVGLGEGLSYVSRIPTAEVRDFATKDAESEKLLNYLEYSLDIPLSQFFGKKFGKHIDEIYFGYTTWHRSSIFGLMSETGGGINYQGLIIEVGF